MDTRYIKPGSSAPSDDFRTVKLVLAGADDPPLSSVTSVLYDLELVHALSTMVAHERYDDRSLATPYFYFRTGHRLHKEDEAFVLRLTKASPLTIEMVIACIGALWILLQMVEKVSNWRQVREKLELENRKLRSEAELKRLELQEKYEARMKQREAEALERQLVARMERSELKLVEISSEPINRSDA
jgi:hypothetical protein